MQTTRQNKVSRLLQKELAELFLKESGNWFNNEFITVTAVRVSPDLSFAKVYVSFFKIENREKSLKNIKVHSTDIRREIGFRVKNQLRIIPSFEYYIDDSLDYVERIEELLKK